MIARPIVNTDQNQHQKAGEFNVPGIMLIQAKLHALKKETRQADKLLQQIRQLNWRLAWLVDKDPIFKSI